MFGGGVRFCQRSVAPLRLAFPGDAGDGEATAAQRNNFSQPLPFSDGDLLRRQRRGWGDLSRSRGPAHRRLLQVMKLLTLLISRKMIFGENLSFARVVGGRIKGRVEWRFQGRARHPSLSPVARNHAFQGRVKVPPLETYF